MTSARLGWLAFALLAIAVTAARAGCWWLHPDPPAVLAQAQADYQAGRYEAAASGLARLARLRTPTPMDRMARALVARARGQDALVELAQIPSEHFLSPQANLLAGQIEVANGRLRAAETHLLAAIARDGSNVHAHRELAYIYNVQHRLHELNQQMEELAELYAVSFEHLLHWAKTRNGRWNSARDCESLAKYLAVDPDDRNTRLALADGLQNLGHIEEAISVLASLPNTDQEARARRATLALERGDRERADSLLSGGPADHPGLAKVRGLFALSRGDPGGAVRQLRIAFAASPDDIGVVSALATALRLAGHDEEARTYLDAERRHTALTPLVARADSPMGPSDCKLPARLGAACEAAGRLAEARAWYHLAIARDPLDTGSQHALFRLRHGAVGRAPNPAHWGRPVGPTAGLAKGH
jgi:Flp pilus assembly protein TadD